MGTPLLTRSVGNYGLLVLGIQERQHRHLNTFSGGRFGAAIG